MTLLPGSRSTIVDVVIVEAFMASLNVTVTVVFTGTDVAPLSGVRAEIVGGVMSAVVKLQLELDTSALPATSFTPDEPPTTVAVYVEEPARDADGVRVATFIPAL